jgi:hypothetical protein
VLSPPLVLESAADFDEDWQVVRLCQRQGNLRVLSACPKQLSPRYLTAVVGRCLNCLSSSHRRADCRLPTRCFNFHGLHHHLRNCKNPQKSPVVLSGSKARTDIGGQHLVQARCDVSWAHPTSQASHGTLPSLRNVGSFDGLAPTPFVSSGFPEPDLTFPIASVCSIPCPWDRMVEGAAMGVTIDVPFHYCHEKVAGMAEHMANPPLTAMLPCLGNLPLPLENIQMPMLFRSEDEQLVGHNLIKDLSNLKLSAVPPLSPSGHHESPSDNEALVVQSKGD